MVNKIWDTSGELIAIYLDDITAIDPGLHFLTEGSESLQMGLFNHPVGHVISKHWHPFFKRELERTSEVLYIAKGLLQVEIFNMDLSLNSTINLGANATIALFSGGHGFTMLEPTIILEVKQGPYAGKYDKILF